MVFSPALTRRGPGDRLPTEFLSRARPWRLAPVDRGCLRARSSPLHSTGDGFANGSVDFARRLLGIAAFEPAGRLRALKELGVLAIIGHLSQFAHHPILSDVTAGDVGNLGEVVGRTDRHLPEHQPPGRRAAPPSWFRARLRSAGSDPRSGA